MNIAICDDDLLEAKKLGRLINEYSQKQNVQIYCSADALIADYRRNIRYDLIFMDIQMEGTNGVQAAEILFDEFNEERPLLVFFTVTDTYLNTTHQYAWWYLRKPVSKDALFGLLKHAWQKLSQPHLILETSIGACNLAAKDVIYVESFDGKTLIHTVNKTYTSNISLTALTQQLPEWLFFQSHRSFYANMLHITDYKKEEITLTNSKSIPLSKRRRSEFESSFRGFLRDKRNV